MDNLYFFSFLGSIYFLLSFVVVHTVRKDIDHTKDALSVCAHGRNGFILTSGLLAIALAQFILAFKIMNSYALLAAISVLILSVFRVDTGQKTIAGRLHNIGAALELLLFPISISFLSPVAGISILLITFLSGLSLRLKYRYFGLVERLNILAIAIWMAYFSYIQVWV